ncbi:hypothetical protein P153DRAFT_198252 [Dothidotthia symphoricarpi CBS 119687]|uniref:Uncharacterized protein n=1 Tax=Dothidotthia symphoricarpi CBS 119687 TaxID=1392245 RepID=A0A6A6AIA8_9PLEO|nr:uncharacterized protein P153DRAFT_198252 [Dothidotthia symphoricarpi CBS 119687]KAF2131550.1 hypothetical protein P153DRAFT_198252 [Dothidotthia symphoricarpi CBS 119687]
MCFYHAYSHKCGHTEVILQQLCSKGQMVQQKCGKGQEGKILTTVKVETSCALCPRKVRVVHRWLRWCLGIADNLHSN